MPLEEDAVLFPINNITIETILSGPPGPTGPVGAIGPQGVQGIQGDPVDAIIKGVPFYNVKDYGALGDGATDDTEAINDTIIAAGPGSRIFFPEGVYGVTADASGYMIINPYDGAIEFFGISRESSIIKVLDGTLDYIGVITDGVSSSFADWTGFQFHDLQIDGNATNNPMADVSFATGPIFNGFPRLSIRCYTGDNGSIWNAQIHDFDNVNSIAINGGSGIVDVWSIHHTLFTATGEGAYHDHSTIYFHGSNIEVSNCVFQGSGQAAIAAVETHGPNQTVRDNLVEDYFGIGNLTGISATNTVGAVWSGNVGRRLGVGITLWARDYGSIVGYALEGIIVSDNDIEIDYDAWSNITAFRYGIALNNTSTGVCRNVKIHHNNIRYLPYSDTPSVNDNASTGILWYRTSSVTEGTEEVDIDISDNVVYAPLAAGIHFETTILTKRVNISDNLIVDNGNGAPSATYRVPIRFSTAAVGGEDITISRNKAVDNDGTHNITCVVDASACSTGIVQGKMVGNSYRCADGTTSLPVHKTHASAAWYVRHEMGTYTANTGLYESGSQVIETSTGLLKTQTAIPTGSTWTSHFPYGGKRSRPRVNYYKAAPGVRGGASSQVTTKDRQYYVKLLVSETTTFDRLGFYVVTGQASVTARVGIYADSGNGVPTGSPISGSTATGLDCSTSATQLEGTISVQLSPGIYWLSMVTQNGTTQPNVYCSITTDEFIHGNSLINACSGVNCYYTSSVTGAMGAFTETGQLGTTPVLAARVSSIP